MLSKTSVIILKDLVSKGIFQDTYDGANIIISLVPYPMILQSYLDSIAASNITDPVTSIPEQAKPFKAEGFTSRPITVQIDNTAVQKSRSDSARQAISDMEV
jgi:hypothetical protein